MGQSSYEVVGFELFSVVMEIEFSFSLLVVSWELLAASLPPSVPWAIMIPKQWDRLFVFQASSHFG